jgi:hypothetical protein
MKITENETTVEKGLSKATCILASLNEDTDDAIYTFELVYPRFIHSEFMTHRVFSRNAQSSRATPTKALIQMVRESPVVPAAYTRNRAGMVGDADFTTQEDELADAIWHEAAKAAADKAEELMRLGVHKQHVNRLLEPFLYIKTVVTATDWDNFFYLRLAADAQPEIRDLAEAILKSKCLAKLESRGNHLPYLSEEDMSKYLTARQLKWVSAARCARVSYYKHDGTKPSVEEDLKLADRLYADGHLSPFEHPARPMEGQHANLHGWQSARNMMGQ